MVDNFIDYLSTHPIAAIIVAALSLLLAYFIVKKFLKLALIVGLILIGVGGYFYYKAPEKFPEDVKSTLNQVREKTEKMIEKSKGAVQKGKDILEKGKDLAERVEKKIKD